MILAAVRPRVTRTAVAWETDSCEGRGNLVKAAYDHRGVVHVITGLEVGGTETMLLELCREESRGGGEFSVASLVSNGPMRERFSRIGVDVVGLGMKRGEFFAPGMSRLVRLIRRARPRVVQGWLYHGNLGAAAATWLSGLFPRPRLGWSIRGDLPDFACYSPQLRRVVSFGARLSPFVDGIFYNSRVALEAHEKYGFRPHLARVVPNGMDLTRFNFDVGARAATRRALGLPDDAIVVIAVGRNDPMKNWPGMLAASDIAGDGRVWLVAVGEGTERLPTGPRRRLLGRRDDMPALYAAADIFMLASHFGEGTSVALSEAMASGLPVVVTAVGDNGSIATGAGLVVPPRDADALTQALAKLVCDPGLRLDAGKAARERAAGFGADRMHAGFHGFCEALLEQPRTRRRQASRAS
jgi:glycosyltransferase involved in cell wall biosynthesis